MTLAEAMPFESALQTLARRGVLPTNLGSAQLRKLGPAFHRHNFTSAKTMLVELLQGYKDKAGSILNPVTEQRADRVTADNPQGNVTVGYDPASARMAMKDLQRSLGFGVNDGSGPITDLTSNARINLVLKTNVELSQGAGAKIQGNDPAVLEAFPCWELKRAGHSKHQRDWGARWVIAANDSGDTDALRVFQETGRMVARKDSPIWSSLGSSRLFDDALDTDFTPLAYGSNMWMFNVAYADAEQLGLIDINQKVLPAEIDFANVFNTEVAA
jgi:hypothetical protein